MTLLKTFWDQNQCPIFTTLDALYASLQNDDMAHGLMYDALCVDDILEHTAPVSETLLLDAIMAQNNKLDFKMRQMMMAMKRAGQKLQVVNYVVTDPFTRLGSANIAVVFELSDGQSVSIFFHNPDVTPKKIAPTDMLVSYKWCLNKKDITIVVAPERGKDIDVRQVAMRIMKLAEKNSEAFTRKNQNIAERRAKLAELNSIIPQKEAKLASLMEEIKALEAQKSDEEVDKLLAEKEAKEGEFVLEKIKVHFTSAPLELLGNAYSPEFSDINSLQQWFERVYPKDILNSTYYKNDVEFIASVRKSGETKSIKERVDVGLSAGDFNPHKQHIADYLKKEFEYHRFVMGNVDRQSYHQITRPNVAEVKAQRQPLTQERVDNFTTLAQQHGFSVRLASVENGQFCVSKTVGGMTANIDGYFKGTAYHYYDNNNADFTVTHSDKGDYPYYLGNDFEEALELADLWLSQFEDKDEKSTNNPTQKDEPIVVSGNEFGEFDTNTEDGKKALREKAVEYLRTLAENGETVFCPALNADVSFNKKGAKKFGALSADVVKLKLARTIKSIIGNGRLIESNVKSYDKEEQLAGITYDYLNTLVKLADKTYNVKTVIRKLSNGKYQYDLQVLGELALDCCEEPSSANKSDVVLHSQENKSLVTDDTTLALDDAQEKYVLNLFLFDENGNPIPDEDEKSTNNPTQKDEPIVVSGNEFGEFDTNTEEGKAELRAKVVDYLKSLKDSGETVFCPALNAEVGFNRESWGKVQRFGGDVKKLYLVTKIKDVIKNGKLVKADKESYVPKEKAQGITYSVLETPVTIQDVKYYARTTIRKLQNGQYQYDLRVNGESELIVDSVENKTLWETQLSKADLPQGLNGVTPLPLKEYGGDSSINSPLLNEPVPQLDDGQVASGQPYELTQEQAKPLVVDDTTLALDDTQEKYVLNLFLFDENGNPIPDEDEDEDEYPFGISKEAYDIAVEEAKEQAEYEPGLTLETYLQRVKNEVDAMANGVLGDICVASRLLDWEPYYKGLIAYLFRDLYHIDVLKMSKQKRYDAWLAFAQEQGRDPAKERAEIEKQRQAYAEQRAKERAEREAEEQAKKEAEKRAQAEADGEILNFIEEKGLTGIKRASALKVLRKYKTWIERKLKEGFRPEDCQLYYDFEKQQYCINEGVVDLRLQSIYDNILFPLNSKTAFEYAQFLVKKWGLEHPDYLQRKNEEAGDERFLNQFVTRSLDNPHDPNHITRLKALAVKYEKDEIMDDLVGEAIDAFAQWLDDLAVKAVETE